MKERIVFLGLFIGLFASVIFTVSCNQTNHGTIQVLDNQANAYNGGCNNLNVNLDGGANQNIYGSSYTFQNVSGGNHTLNFSTSGQTSDSGTQTNCSFAASGTANYSCNFNVSDGILYTASVFNSGLASSVSILCP